MDIINILAIVISPIIAVLISIWVQNRKEKQQHKMYIFTTLMATRHSPIIDEKVRALNMIDVVFHDKPRVRQLWREYFDMLGNEGLNNPTGWDQRQKKNLELIHEIAKVLGYGKAITHLDVDRVYYPVGLGEKSRRTDELLNELLRVLRASGGLQVVSNQQSGLEVRGTSPNVP